MWCQRTESSDEKHDRVGSDGEDHSPFRHDLR